LSTPGILDLLCLVGLPVAPGNRVVIHRHWGRPVAELLHGGILGRPRQGDLLVCLQPRSDAMPGGIFVPGFIDLSPGAQAGNGPSSRGASAEGTGETP